MFLKFVERTNMSRKVKDLYQKTQNLMMISLKWAKNAPKRLKSNLSANVKIFSFLHIVEVFLPIPILNYKEKYFLGSY
jgi:hypothetical protein